MQFLSRQIVAPTQTAASESAAGSRRLDFVDGLRGIAILLVVLRHYYMHAYDRGFPRWADILSLGYLGVHLFLILSGFCVAWAYVGPKARPFDLKDFAYRRATRILPAYYIMLLIVLLMDTKYEGMTLIGQIASHLTMTYNFLPDHVLALNGTFWSLALECQLYLFFPLLLFSARRWGMGVTLAVVFVFQTAFRVFALRYGTAFNDLTFVLPWSAFGRLFEFTLGMWAAIIVAHRVDRPLPVLFQRALPFVTLIALAGGALAKMRLDVTHPMTDLCWSIGFVGMLLCGQPGMGYWARFLAWRPLVFVGVASYSIYLVHSVLISYVIGFCFALTQHRVPPIWLMPLPVLLNILICLPYYFLVEKPFQNFFARLRKRARPAPASAG
jgi:peptidoglycan/LPS O-acetylase OafA/YrhL